MCTININVDEAELRELRPNLDNTIAISLWVQELVNLQMQKMRLENEETIDLDTAHEMTLQAVRKENVCGLSARHQQALLRDMTPEQLYAVIAEEIDEIYANG